LSAYATIASLSTGNWNSAWNFVSSANNANTLSIDNANHRVGVLTSTPYKSFNVNGDVAFLSNDGFGSLEIL
jgi:hypothetical protein